MIGQWNLLWLPTDIKDDFPTDIMDDLLLCSGRSNGISLPLSHVKPQTFLWGFSESLNWVRVNCEQDSSSHWLTNWLASIITVWPFALLFPRQERVSSYDSASGKKIIICPLWKSYSGNYKELQWLADASITLVDHVWKAKWELHPSGWCREDKLFPPGTMY